MDRPEEIAKKGDQYAKRLLVRKKDLNQSFESFSKSLRRRKKIMDAISKNKMTSVTAVAVAAVAKPSNTGKDELANSDDDVSSWPECSVENNLSAESCCFQSAEAIIIGETYADAPARKSLSGSTEANFNFNNSIHRRRQSSGQQFRRDLPLAELLEAKVSLGEYFGAKSHKEMRVGDFLSRTTNAIGEEEVERRKVDAKKQQRNSCNVKAEYLNARVLEILEPEVVHVECGRSSFGDPSSRRRRVSDVTFIREEFPPPTAPPMERGDSTITSSCFASKEHASRQHDREMEKLRMQQPNAEVCASRETPKTSMYPNLSSMERRMSDRCSKKLFEHVIIPPDSADAAESSFDGAARRAIDNETCCSFSTAQATQLMSSGCLQGLQQHQLTPPRTRRNKPNLESTRKLVNSVLNPALSASQNGTTISTLTLPNTPNTPFSPFTADEQYYAASTGQRQPQTEEVDGVPVEVDNFLRLALGEEYCDSRANTSELLPMSEDYKATPHPSTLNRSFSACKTLTKSIKRRLKSSRKREPRLQVRRPDADGGGASTTNPHVRDTRSVKRLLDLLEVYQTQIYQASKALDLCNSMREFRASSERVELERLLLVASLGKMSAREEIRRVAATVAARDDDDDDDSGSLVHSSCERAELTIEDLSVQLREDLPRRDDRVEWLMIVVSEGLTVWATQAVVCPLTEPRVHFPGGLSLVELTPDFRLSLGVYSMRLQGPIQLYKHEDKYHISSEESNKSSCPSPRRFLSGKSRSSFSPKQHEIRFSGIKQSAFSLCASLELTLKELHLMARQPPAAWPLRGVGGSKQSAATIDMDLKCRLRLSVCHAGFLTHGDEPGGLIAWSRRWCVLEGRSLLFWNYPREQEDNKPALYAIDLVGCVSRRVELADRSLCPRPRTLLVETVRRRSPVDEDSMVFHCRHSWTIVRNLLSCDTHQDLIEWQSKLNHVVSTLREWNVIDTKSLPISDL